MKIFLSYASEDEAIAQQIKASLTTAKNEVFFSEESINPGADFVTEIARSLNRSDLFVFLISPDSVKKDCFTQNEIDLARSKWPNPVGHVLPVLIRDTPFDTISTYIRTVSIQAPEGDKGVWVVNQVKKFKSGIIIKKSVRVFSWIGVFLVGFAPVSYFLGAACYMDWRGCINLKRELPQIAEVTINCRKSSLASSASPNSEAEPNRTLKSVYILVDGRASFITQITKRLEEIKDTFGITIHDKTILQQYKIMEASFDRNDAFVAYSRTVMPQFSLPIPTKKGEQHKIHFFGEYAEAIKSGSGDEIVTTPQTSFIKEMAYVTIEPEDPSEDHSSDLPKGFAVTKFNLNLIEGNLKCWE